MTPLAILGLPGLARTKADNTITKGPLQPIPVAVILWTNIAMSFLVDLPAPNGFVTIFVVIDRFSKMLCFILPKESEESEESEDDVAAASFENIIMVFPPASCFIIILISKACYSRFYGKAQRKQTIFLYGISSVN